MFLILSNLVFAFRANFSPSFIYGALEFVSHFLFVFMKADLGRLKNDMKAMMTLKNQLMVLGV